MRLKPEWTLYVRSMGKALKVTAIFSGDDSTDAANAYCAKHADEGVVAQFGTFVLTANLYDKGADIKE